MTQFKLKKLFFRKAAATGLALAMLMVGAVTFLAASPDKDHGKGYLGVSIEKLSGEEKEEFGVKFGVLVTRVVKEQAAEKAGIKKYDVLQYFNDEKLRRPDDLIDAVRDTKPGTKAKVKLVRDGKSKDIPVTVGKLKSRFNFKFGDGKNFVFKDKNFVFKHKSGGFLGVHLQKLNEDLAGYFAVKADGGALIAKVGEDTPAEKAGLKAGDVILKIEDKNVANPGDVTKILSGFEEGDKVSVQVMRHKKKKNVKAELAENPGFKNIRIFRGTGDKGLRHIPELHKIDIRIPEIHMDEDSIIRYKKSHKHLEKKLKGVEEKLHKKLKKIEEYIYI